MASHYVSINRGIEGLKSSDFTTGTSSTAGDGIELRVLDGAGLSKKDLLIGLKALIRFVEDSKQMATAGIDVTG